MDQGALRRGCGGPGCGHPLALLPQLSRWPRTPPHTLPPLGRSCRPGVGGCLPVGDPTPRFLATIPFCGHRTCVCGAFSLLCPASASRPEGSAKDSRWSAGSCPRRQSFVALAVPPGTARSQGNSPERARGARAVPAPAAGQGGRPEQRAGLAPGGVRGAQPWCADPSTGAEPTSGRLPRPSAPRLWLAREGGKVPGRAEPARGRGGRAARRPGPWALCPRPASAFRAEVLRARHGRVSVVRGLPSVPLRPPGSRSTPSCPRSRQGPEPRASAPLGALSRRAGRRDRAAGSGGPPRAGQAPHGAQGGPRGARAAAAAGAAGRGPLRTERPARRSRRPRDRTPRVGRNPDARTAGRGEASPRPGSRQQGSRSHVSVRGRCCAVGRPGDMVLSDRQTRKTSALGFRRRGVPGVIDP